MADAENGATIRERSLSAALQAMEGASRDLDGIVVELEEQSATRQAIVGVSCDLEEAVAEIGSGRPPGWSDTHEDMERLARVTADEGERAVTIPAAHVGPFISEVRKEAEAVKDGLARARKELAKTDLSDKQRRMWESEAATYGRREPGAAALAEAVEAYTGGDLSLTTESVSALATVLRLCAVEASDVLPDDSYAPGFVEHVERAIETLRFWLALGERFPYEDQPAEGGAGAS